MIMAKANSIKQIMGKLLVQDTFDPFLLQEAVVTTNLVFTIDGHQVKEFYTEEEWKDKDLCPYPLIEWKAVKEYLFMIMKGKKTPVSFKFVLHVKPEHMVHLLTSHNSSVTPDQMRAFVLTIRYDGSVLTMTSATSANSFLLDKSPDTIWDQALLRFLDRAEIDYSIS